MNQNLIQFEAGNRFRLEISTAHMQRVEPEFAPSRIGANRRKRLLQDAGYRVAIFSIRPTGGLVRAA